MWYISPEELDAGNIDAEEREQFREIA